MKCIGFAVCLLALTVAGVQAQEDEPQDPTTAEEERVSFNVTLSGDEGGGRVAGTAGDFEYQPDRFLLATGGVELKYKDLRLQARRVRLDLPSNLMTAEGNVVLDEGPERLTGETLEYDLGTRTGRVTQATAYVDPDYYFSGSQIAKVGDDVFTIDDGVFTSCEQDVPSWSIHLSDARITIDEYARIRNARLKFGRVPVLYAPYIVWPATTDRASGFLVPKPGYSERRGASLDLAYYRTLGRSADTTFFLDASSEEFLGFGNETRYHPSEGTEGYFRFYGLSQPDDIPLEYQPVFEPGRDSGDLRWKLELFHESKDLWGKYRGVVSIQEYSDLDYLQDFERNVGRQTRSFIYSNAYLTRNFGNQSFNILLDQRERILVLPRKDVRRQLPEVEYKLRPTQLGNTPLYLSLTSALHYLSLETESLESEYGRADVKPTLSIPLSTLSWLSVKAEVGGRATYYSDSLRQRFDADGNPLFDENGDRIPLEFSGDSLTRTVPEGGVEIVGPVLSRIYDRKGGRFSKVKHIIEPRTTYRYLDEFDEQQQIFRFDEIDNVAPANGLVFSLFNRVMVKSRDPDEGGAFEIGSFELRQGYSLDDQRPGQVSILDPENDKAEGPLSGILRINPSPTTSVKLDVRYNTLFNELQSLSFSGGTKIGRHALGLTLFTNWRVETLDDMRRAGEKTSEQVRLFGKVEVLPRRLTIDAQVSYDTVASRLRQQRYFLNWKSQCYNWQLEFRESVRGSEANPIKDTDFRFALTLKNVGTFLDLNESF